MNGRVGLVVAVAIAGIAFPSASPAQTATDTLSTAVLKMMSLEQLMNIDVTIVSRQAERLLDAPAAVAAITGGEILRGGATSIPEALRLSNGLHVAKRTSQAWSITSRGFNTELVNKLLVLFDGRTLYSPLFSGVYWDRQDYLLEDIDRIEVVSGPGGTVWGANAVNGVINILSKSAHETKGLYAEAGAGTAVRDLVGIRYGADIDEHTSARAYVKHVSRHGGTDSAGTTKADDWDMTQGGFRLDATLSDASDVTLQGDYYRLNEGLTEGGRSHVRAANVLGRWSATIAHATDVRVQGYYDRTDLVLPARALIVNGMEFAPAGVFTDLLETYDIDAQVRHVPSDGHTLTLGAGFRVLHDRLGNAPSLSFFPSTVQQKLFSSFVQYMYGITDDVTLLAGTKVEHNDYTGWEVEPGLRAQWSLTNDHSVWGAVSRAIRAPSRIDRDLSQPAPPYLVILKGGSNFRSETLVSYEIGYRGNVSPFATVSTSFFYNVYDHVRSTSTTPSTILPFFFENNLTAETYGLECTADLQAYEWWRMRAGYAFLGEEIQVKPGTTDFNLGRNETSDPRHRLLFHSTFTLSQSLVAMLRTRWVGALEKNSATFVGTVPSYAELGVTVTWKLHEHLRLSVTGENLIHRRHPEYGYPDAARQEVPRSVCVIISMAS